MDELSTEQAPHLSAVSSYEGYVDMHLSAVSSHQGWVDTLTPHRIAGWAHDECRPDQSLFVDVHVNGECVARVKACLYRDDLLQHGMGDGRKGFDVNLSPYFRGGENHVRVTYSGTDHAILNGDQSILNVEGFEGVTAHNEAELLELSQVRWKEEDERDNRLTWGTLMTGDSFLDVVEKHHQFTGKETVLEIGPGYGRLLSTLLERKLPFAEFLGLEISGVRAERLTQRFPVPGVRFVEADILKDQLDACADVVLCSSTFEHLFPSMLKALHNLRAMSTPHTKLFIDFVQWGTDYDLRLSRAHFEQTTAYIRVYSRGEIEDFFAQAGFRVVGSENIVLGKDTHGNDVPRVLVIAQRAA